MDFSLIWDWLGREGGYIVRWWLLVTLAGAAVWPLLWRVLSGLPDRGYTLARAAGLMLTGFIFWFLGSLGLLQNAPGGMVFAWIVVLLCSVAAWLSWGERPSLREWWREHRALVIAVEVLFVLLLVGWAAIRAHNPVMAETEKPMEIMFINAIRASDTFPPQDAWLSGYAISYYYFGYLIIAMLADLASMPTSIAFTLTIALLFALTGIGALGVAYNLVRAPRKPRSQHAERAPSSGGSGAGLTVGVLALVFVTLMGSLGTALVEVPFWGHASSLVNADYFDFWDVPERQSTYTLRRDDGTVVELVHDQDTDGVPNWADDPKPLDEWSFTWGVGWRYSRIINDRDINGEAIGVQPINEFPSFSFILADLHPHVLALPFAALAIALALNLVLRGSPLRVWEYPLYAIWVGGMVFMNSWDAIYLPLLLGAEVLRRIMRNGEGVLHIRDLIGLARFIAGIGGLTLVLYAPWLISFTSQAGGVVPNLIYPTPWQQYFLQFGAFIIILTVFLFTEYWRAGERFNWLAGGLAVLLTVVFALMSLLALGYAAWDRADIAGTVFAGVDRSAESFGSVLPDVLARRLDGLPSEMILIAFLLLVTGRLWAVRPAVPVFAVNPDEREVGRDQVVRVRGINFSGSTGFTLLLIGAGAVLTLGPDFLYLRDNFAVRINTVFKLYYQGWLLFSLASAYAVWSVLVGEPSPVAAKREAGTVQPIGASVISGRMVFGAIVVVLLVAGLLYPLTAINGRILIDSGRQRTQDTIADCEAHPDAWATTPCPEQTPLTLDGAPRMIGADEYAAVQCLAALEHSGDAVIAEAPGGAYQPERSRFSALTGIPTLIGWQNHERQWRGTTYPSVTDYRFEFGVYRDRATDVQELYTTADWSRAWYVIDRYGIDYVVVGYAERLMIQDMAGDDLSLLGDFQRGLDKFGQVFDPVCRAGNTSVYRVAPE